jgi:branched-chain amino acid transport system permease protein
MKAWRYLAVAAMVCALAGCGGVIDARQARTCRSIIPALNTGDADIEVMRAVALRSGDGLHIAYRVSVPAGPTRERFVECRFTAQPSTGDSQALLSVLTDAGPMGELRLQLLRRFWLDAEGAKADTEPVGGARQAPAVPRGVAIGLQHLLLALPPMAIYALLGAAYSLVYGLVGRINLAFGELAAASGYAAYLGVAIVSPAAGVTTLLLAALALALTAGLSYGIATGRFVFAPMMRQSGQRVLIGTIALAIVLQEFLRLAQGARLKWVQPMLNAPYAVARAGDFVVTVTPVAMAAAVLCLLTAALVLGLMRRSRFGRAWRACADDPGAAELFGVDRRMVLLKTFALASVTAGLAGYVVTIYYGTLGYAGGVALGLKALLAAVAGGIGSVAGAFLGGLLLGGAEAAWSALFPIEHRELVIFSLLVVMLVLRPNGLFGFAAQSVGWVERRR